MEKMESVCGVSIALSCPSYSKFLQLVLLNACD